MTPPEPMEGITVHRHRWLWDTANGPACACGVLRDPRGIILAIDPGPERSAYVVFDESGIVPDEIGDPLRDVLPNEMLLTTLREREDNDLPTINVLVIEKVEGYGMPVGAEVFETVYWSGRFAEAASPLPVHRIGRKAVKVHLCGTTKAKDPNVRQALIDRYGGKDTAIGRKAAPGPLYGVSGDVWAALAVAVTFHDQEEKP